MSTPDPHVVERAERGQAGARLREMWGDDRVPELTDEARERTLADIADAQERAARLYRD